MFIAMYLGTALGRTNDHNTSHSKLSRGWLDQTAKLRWRLKKCRKRPIGRLENNPSRWKRMTTSLHDQVREQLTKELAVRSASTQPEQLVQALRYLAKWRSVIIQNTVLKHCGVLVQSGPFSWMTFLEQSS